MNLDAAIRQDSAEQPCGGFNILASRQGNEGVAVRPLTNSSATAPVIGARRAGARRFAALALLGIGGAMFLALCIGVLVAMLFLR